MRNFIGRKEFFRLMSYMKPRMKSYLVGLFGQSIGNAAIYIILAFVLKYLVEAANKGNMDLIYYALKLIGITLLGLVVLLPIFFYYYKKAVRITVVEIKKAVFSKIQRLPIEYFDKNHSGNIVSRFSNDILLAEKAFTEGLREIITTVILGFGSAIIMFVLNWKIALSLLALGLLLTSINLLFAKPIRDISDKIQTNIGFLTERFSDQLAGFYLIKMFKTESLINKRFFEQNEEVKSLSVIRVNKTAVLEGTNYLLSMIGFGGALVIGTIMVISGEVDFSTLIAIVQFQINVSEAFLSIGKCFSTLQISLASAQRIFELLDLEEEKFGDGKVIVQDKNPIIEFNNVVYSYNASKKALDGISISINKGEVIAVIGPSGGGKSTLLKLLLGFYEVSEGEIKLYGKSIGEYSFEQLRNHIAYVPQQSYLFADTIEQNIRCSRSDVTYEEVIEAAKSANAHEFIVASPEGYNLQVEEGGRNMSGGQRQRIAIARAFLKDSQVVLLDEATSALDSENEYKIQEAMQRLMKEKTVIIVAHRLSTIEKADKIFVVDGGKIKEMGNHSELIKRDGIYNALIKNNKY